MASNSEVTGAARVQPHSRNQEILWEQVRLLYASANVALGVTVLAATILAYLQSGVIRNRVVLEWWFYMFLVAAARWAVALGYRRASRGYMEIDKWRAAFTVGAGLAGAGWGGAGIFLYPEAAFTHQVFLVFVLGGMMLGAASLLAPRPEAFLAFLIPTGLAPAVRLLLQGDETHIAMGLLAAVFTLATLITTRRIYSTIDSSLRLQYQNRDLVADLKTAKSQTEALNQALEIRIQERTAELQKSTELLRAEIEQRQQMEEELLRGRKLESLGLLAGGIAHDFNNFLTIIQGNIEVATNTLDSGHASREMLGQAASACQRAVFLSSQLLTFAKGGSPVRRVVSAASLVLDAVQLARAGTTVEIAVDITEDLRFVLVDPGQIGQVLHNILLNARQAMSQGGIIEVLVKNVEASNSPASGPRVRISIRDCGCGIPADVLPKIFDPYFTTKPGGSGLGLATAYSIVTRHDGHISVESKIGEGTVCTVDLPALVERPAPEDAIVTAVQTGTERILVMDDEEALRKLIGVVLGNLGYEVQTARNGAEAIALYEAAMEGGKRFDAVLLDLTVSGGMGGIEAAAKLKEIDPSSKLVVSSGYSDTAALSDFGRYGFDAAISKPWTSAQISSILRRLLAFDSDRKPD